MKKTIFMLILALALLASGCAGKTAPSSTPENESKSYDISTLEDYIASVQEQASALRTSLEQEALTQTDMNIKSQELYELWDSALNYLWEELSATLPKKEFGVLQEKQRTWITEKETAITEAGKEVEGGSLYPLVVNSEAANITEERVYELYALLKE